MKRRAPPEVVKKLNKKPHFQVGENLAPNDAIHHEGVVYLSDRAAKAFQAGQAARIRKSGK
jgi:hypothetical protein